MNKKVSAIIAKVILLLVAIVFLTILLDNFRSFPYLFDKPIDYKETDPSTGEKYTHERKLRYVLLPEIDSLIYSDNPKKAMELIDSIIPEYQNNKGLYFNKGLSLAMMDSFELAITYFDKTIFINDSIEKSRNKKGFHYINSLHYKYECFVALENYNEAIVVLKKLIDLNPDYNNEIAHVYELKKDYKKSIKHFRLIKEEYEKSEDSLILLQEIKYFRDKIKELEKIMK